MLSSAYVARQGCVCRRELVAVQGEESAIAPERRGGEMGMDSPDPGDGRMHDRISLREIRTLLEIPNPKPRSILGGALETKECT